MMKRLLFLPALLLWAGSASAQDLNVVGFSATGTVHMAAVFTLGEYTRGNGQVNKWASNDWAGDGGAGRVGSVDQGTVVFDDPLSTTTPPARITLRRIAKWDSLDRLIINTISGQGNIGALFDETSDPYRLTIVHITGGLTVMHTWIARPETNGNDGFVDWREDEGAMTDAMWTFIDSLAAGDEILLAIHEGTPAYSPPLAGKEYVGGVEIVREYVGDILIVREYIGQDRTRVY